MSVVAIVQARLGSSRLPGKVLADIAGDTMLARVVQRLRAASRVHRIVIATTTASRDDAVAAEALRLGAGCFRGSEHDVLARYAGAARAFSADVVVRVTSDCPLIDPDVVDRVIDALDGSLTSSRDYASNTHERTYPRGLDVEALPFAALARIAELATSLAAREHVTAFVRERPALFSVAHVRADVDDSDLRWTVDTAEDLQLVRALYDRLDLSRAIAPYRAVVAAVRAEPALAAINAHVEQKAWNHVS